MEWVGCSGCLTRSESLTGSPITPSNLLSESSRNFCSRSEKASSERDDNSGKSAAGAMVSSDEEGGGGEVIKLLLLV